MNEEMDRDKSPSQAEDLLETFTEEPSQTGDDNKCTSPIVIGKVMKISTSSGCSGVFRSF